MRILQVVHDFLPRHVAGVEVYTDNLARALARDHTVGLLFTESVPDAADYTLRRGRHGAVATFEIVNNHAYRSFAESWSNPGVEARMREVLDEFRPDVVHLQHLINLSLGLLDEVERRGLPLVMTLHEHWLACASGGQRFHRELGRCDVLDARRCGACTAHGHPAPTGLAARLAGAPLAAAGGSGTLRLAAIAPHAVETPDPRYVYRDRYVLHGATRDTWVAHPPSCLRFELEVGPQGLFAAHVALHPSTLDRLAGAVRFEVRVDGEVIADARLDPRRVASDRFPRVVSAQLAPGRRRLELVTATDPPEAVEFATAGWIEPTVRDAASVPRSAREWAGRAALRFADAIGRGPLSAPRRSIERRWDAVRAAAPSVDRFLLPSRHLLAEMARFGLPADRLVHCDYGFAVEDFERRSDLPELARHFAFIGSVMPHKGMHVLLEAFAGLPADARLSVAGSPGYDPAYSTWLRGASEHPGVRFLGGLSPADVPAFLASVDALVVPSIWEENSPLTIHEAFLVGVPVVASRMGGSTELVEAGGGLLYDADDPRALQAVLLRLYAEPGLARRLAASAPPVKSNKEHVAELVELYDRLRSERRRSS